MQVTVLGSRYAKGTNKAGRPYEGFYTSISYKQTGYDGEKAEEKFLPCDLLKGYVPQPGDILDLNTDFRGFIQSIDLAV